MKRIGGLVIAVVLMLMCAACDEQKTVSLQKETEEKKEIQIDNTTQKTEEAKEKSEEKTTSLPVDENYIIQYYAATKQTIPQDINPDIPEEEMKSLDIKYFLADVTGDGIVDLIADGEGFCNVYTIKKGRLEKVASNTGGFGSGYSFVKYNEDYCIMCYSSHSSREMRSVYQYRNGQEKEIAISETVLNEEFTTVGYKVNGKMVPEEEYEAFNEKLDNSEVELYSAETLKEKALKISPKHDEKLDYEAVYKNFLKEYEAEIGKKSGKVVCEYDDYTPSSDCYKTEEGLVTHVIDDFNSDGVLDLILVQEVEADLNGENGADMYIKAYTVSDHKIVCMDAYLAHKYSGGMIGRYPYVDITVKDKKLRISGIYSWGASPSSNVHYVLKLSGNQFDVEYLDSLDNYLFDGELQESHKEMTKRLNSQGFRYKEGDVGGLYDKDAERLAIYILKKIEPDDEDIDYMGSYFEGTVTQDAGFYNYSN